MENFLLVPVNEFDIISYYKKNSSRNDKIKKVDYAQYGDTLETKVSLKLKDGEKFVIEYLEFSLECRIEKWTGRERVEWKLYPMIDRETKCGPDFNPVYFYELKLEHYFEFMVSDRLKKECLKRMDL
jgi:hypothetical protein